MSIRTWEDHLVKAMRDLSWRSLSSIFFFFAGEQSTDPFWVKQAYDAMMGVRRQLNDNDWYVACGLHGGSCYNPPSWWHRHITEIDWEVSGQTAEASTLEVKSKAEGDTDGNRSLAVILERDCSSQFTTQSSNPPSSFPTPEFLVSDQMIKRQQHFSHPSIIQNMIRNDASMITSG